MRGRVDRSIYIAGGLVAVLLVGAGAIWSWPLSEADEWAALAAWITAAVALVAGGVAVGQLGEARRLRFEQAQPYVVVCMEPSPASSWFVDLVVRNFGTTAAHDVRLQIEPAPQRHSGKGDDVWLPAAIPVLAPGQEWRTYWDSGERIESQLPRRHEAVVTFKDSHGRTLPELRSILDWGVLENRVTIDIYGSHHAAKALRQIDKTLAGWREGPRGLRAYVRDGDAKDARERERMEQRRREEQQRQGDVGGPQE